MQKTLLLDTFLEPFHSGIQSTNIIADSPSLDIFKNRPPKSTYPSIVVISHASFHREFANYYTEQNYFRFMFNLPIFWRSLRSFPKQNLRDLPARHFLQDGCPTDGVKALKSHENAVLENRNSFKSLKCCIQIHYTAAAAAAAASELTLF